MMASRRHPLAPACARWRRSFDAAVVGDEDELSARTRRAHEDACGRCALEAARFDHLSGRLQRIDVDDEDVRVVVVNVLRRKVRVSSGVRFPRWRLWALGGAAVAAAASLTISSRPTPLAPLAPPEPVVGSASLLLVAGRAQLSGHPAEPGAVPRDGDVVDVADGRACLRLPDDVTLCADARTSFTLASIGAANKRVDLTRGVLLADLPRQRPGRSFVVHTAHGFVRTLGTRFVVAADADGTAVRVQHGRVHATDASGRGRDIDRLGAWRLGSVGAAAPWRASPPVADDELGWLADLVNSPTRGHVAIAAARPGRELWIDGRRLGPLPVVGQIGAGHHVVELRGEHAGARETFHLAPDGEKALRLDDPVAASPVEAPRAPRAIKRQAAEASSSEPRAPTDLLRAARTLRAEGRYAEAAEAYRRLHSLAPQSPDGATALVLLADVLLAGLDQPEEALRTFERYLSSGDRRYEQEAGYGRIKALRLLGRSSEERAAIEALLARHPSGPHAAGLRARLETLGRK